MPLIRAIEYCAQWDWSIFTVTSGGGSIDNGKRRQGLGKSKLGMPHEERLPNA